MKLIARYLDENSTPEWKRAYIDYRACKKAIKVIARRLGQERSRIKNGEQPDKGSGSHESSDDVDHGPSAPPRSSKGTSPSMGSGGKSPRDRGRASLKNTPSIPGSAQYGATTSTPRHKSGLPPNPPPLDIGEPSVAHLPESTAITDDRIHREPSHTQHKPGTVTFTENPPSPTSPEGSHHRSSEDPIVTSDSNAPLRPNAAPRSGSKTRKSPRRPFGIRSGSSPFIQGHSPKLDRKSVRSMTFSSPRIPARSAKTFEELYGLLEPDEKAFFDLLDRELNKVETFYRAREGEAIRRAHDLRDQLRELAEHRKIYHEIYPEGTPEWETKVGRILPSNVQAYKLSTVANNLQRRIPFFNGGDSGREDEQPKTNGALGERRGSGDDENKALREAIVADKDHQTYNPERYLKYKKDLRGAVLEFYRQLELIKNYRIMNLTGFRKALKKFEKTTRIHCLEMYTDERVLKESFTNGDTVDALIQKVEEMFSEHFERGDSKKARDKLRRQHQVQTHYTTTFRSGWCIGAALPAAIYALVLARQKDTQAAVPQWEALLYLYAGLFLPVIFAMLVELNLDAYVAARINYEFVMELSRPSLDFRSYLEETDHQIPAFLFLTLCYCFFFTFSRVGEPHIAPTTWPAVWVVFVVVFFLNPLPVWRKRSRYWLLKVLFRVLTPGYSRVEFIAFFIADELNSLVFTMQDIYFLGCAYSRHWPPDVLNVCPVSKNWPSAILICIPALSRLIQCLKRYHDSKLRIHLINAGKYLSVITQLILYVLWRSRGGIYHDPAFVVWIIVATISSTYACSWDLIVDWSLFRPNSGGLRPDLGYQNRYVYYFAMVTNIIIRFVWVWYLPYPTQHTRLRSFFFSLAEMLRRWQWNFFRVETEHLGNADAYRVTREIPLPYRRVEHDSDEETHLKSHHLSVHLDRLRQSIRKGSGRGPDELDVGPRGHAASREYEARRPGDSSFKSRNSGEV
ncbi:hypothetical protein TREMEDRAFT_70627 [Tremella mesenterica DSM 1558]|uniref:uncharacterized protein n=1 Tax=Tremella mesenterica (strain ATCC 24925 / CBS 8224 / DSM 1558 / NBRC 9311 / NRRL Y-6157 / RJB 2259-6 / UBC 559-6) TaxID=578456 RepID=UPI0003F4997E|nr:uncharacterized protein TREMEDRAFT_70627 [Tremella mesenterica DSM 1558]EIW72108.1 hypothetical protein TREMEDRAFT_70627 [Tremella mesenterica DSM 1558]